MKLKSILLAIAGLQICGCLSPGIAESEPVTDFNLQPAQFDSIGIVKSPSPVIMRGMIQTRRSKDEIEKSRYYSSESTVMRSLRWLKKEQNKDGSWSTRKDPKAVATALSLLCFLAHGETPASQEFGLTVENAIRYLLSIQDEKGWFNGATKNPAIEHGVIALALCDTFGMTKAPCIKDAAIKAVDVILESQLPSGLWSSTYKTNDGPDIEASVWQIRALKAARLGGLEDERLLPAIERTATPLKAYVEEGKHQDCLAPVIVALCYSGNGNDPVCIRATESLNGLSMNWSKPQYDNPIYQWHYITQASFFSGGDVWRSWTKRFCLTLCEPQRIIENGTKDHRGNAVDIGYWISPSKKERYGKIYATALSCQMLEICSSRRRLPTFVPVLSQPEAIEDDDDIEIEIY
jgi:hypothetical protein